MQNIQTNRYTELDALRGVAALMVVFFHFTLSRPPYDAILKTGTTGVDLFFMISGFVIFMSLHNISNGKEFIINRVSRLYPTYWASVTFTFLAILVYFYVTRDPDINPVKTVLYYLGNLTMFQFYMRIPNLDIPYWTMIIEMLFYVSALILYRLKWLKHINSIGVALCITSVMLGRYLANNRIAFIILHGFPLLQFIPLFFAGILFYKIYTQQQRLFQYFLLAVCLVCQLLLFPFVGGSHFYISYSEYSLMLCIFFCVFTLFVNHGLKFIVSPVVLFFGRISFALYLTHQFISLTILFPWLVGRMHFNFWLVALLIDLPIVVGIATAITYWIEIPYGKKMKLYLRERLL